MGTQCLPRANKMLFLYLTCMKVWLQRVSLSSYQLCSVCKLYSHKCTPPPQRPPVSTVVISMRAEGNDVGASLYKLKRRHIPAQDKQRHRISFRSSYCTTAEMLTLRPALRAKMKIVSFARSRYMEFEWTSSDTCTTILINSHLPSYQLWHTFILSGLSYDVLQETIKFLSVLVGPDAKYSQNKLLWIEALLIKSNLLLSYSRALCCDVTNVVNRSVQFTLEQAKKAQRGSRGIALLCL